MSPEERQDFAQELREKLNSRRDVFVVSRFMFEPTKNVPLRQILHGEVAEPNNSNSNDTKTISAAALRLLLDYCESNWPMDFVEYCAGIFQGRAPREGEQAFDLIPNVQERLSAERLGFGHIYGEGGD